MVLIIFLSVLFVLYNNCIIQKQMPVPKAEPTYQEIYDAALALLEPYRLSEYIKLYTPGMINTKLQEPEFKQKLIQADTYHKCIALINERLGGFISGGYFSWFTSGAVGITVDQLIPGDADRKMLYKLMTLWRKRFLREERIE